MEALFKHKYHNLRSLVIMDKTVKSVSVRFMNNSIILGVLLLAIETVKQLCVNINGLGHQATLF